jgi:hypothetical protein
MEKKNLRTTEIQEQKNSSISLKNHHLKSRDSLLESTPQRLLLSKKLFREIPYMLKDKIIMSFRKSIFIVFLGILQLFNAQRKKADTLYVYEKVIVYDTVYLEKALK